MVDFRFQYKSLQLRLMWGEHPQYIETNVSDDALREKIREMGESMDDGVRRRNIERPAGKRIVGRNLHRW